MSMKRWVYVVLLIVVCCGCVNKKTAENENKPENDNTTSENINNFDYFLINEKVYVASSDGLNLRADYGITGTKIRLLPQNTELIVLEKSEEKEIIDEMNDYWYKVDTGEETGWIFGGYVSHNPNERDGKIQIPERIKITGRENHDWLTEYGWYLEDGRYLVDPSVTQIDWIGEKAPLVVFQKFDIPPNSVLYQVRLRKEKFYFFYQTEEEDKLFPVGSAIGTEVFDLEFGNNYSYISLSREGFLWGYQYRDGQQTNPDYPLVGIWGKLPALEEYRLINSADCVYYMEIDRKIPGWAVRRGTYLLKRTGDSIFETITSFSDGYLRLEIKDEKLFLLTPLFTLSEESEDKEGWVAPLAVYRIPGQKNDPVVEEEY